MSRGGRGGGRGGMLKGVSWEYDPTQTLDSAPTELFPDYTIPFASPASPTEQRAVRLYKDLREQIHHGPLYTKAPPRDPNTAPKVFGEEQENELFEMRGRTDTDPFVGVPTYTMKYDRKERAIPMLSGRPFIKAFFPPELHATLEGSDGLAARNTISRAIRKKLILAREPGLAGATEEERKRALLAKLDGAAEEDGEEEEGEEEGEEEDYNYEDDEEEMGGDYDAEQYFDDGGEGGDDDEGGGGGDDY
ncbi:hypothetical protein V496_04341 [Pseudogymnoascus sp. VKM F-4515 (FW-2607)]|nr:hypothetical protein V496_04341 [Pseudogymnoascus sp. VKM F-4515 (FW-2607)]KFY96131.1 hypothetical protein V498_02881 [Pseudogymnoascus sp. VKM F-4517 (FW-2822)]